MINLPFGLCDTLKSGNGVLFLGAGIGSHLHSQSGRRGPIASELAEELAQNFKIETEDFDLAKIAQLVELRKSRETLETFLRRRLHGLEPDLDLQWLFTHRWRAIYTTNYDNAIKRAYELLEKPLQNPVIFQQTSDLTWV